MRVTGAPGLAHTIGTGVGVAGGFAVGVVLGGAGVVIGVPAGIGVSRGRAGV